MEIIKVHVTEAQRAELELLVNRRLSDVKHLIRTGKATTDYGFEIADLEALKKELYHAGT